MGKTTRLLAVGLVAVAISTWAELKLGATIPAADQVGATDEQQPTSPDVPVAPTDPRVRTEDPFVAALIRDAADRAPTFRRLVEAIQATDGVFTSSAVDAATSSEPASRFGSRYPAQTESCG